MLLKKMVEKCLFFLPRYVIEKTWLIFVLSRQ